MVLQVHRSIPILYTVGYGLMLLATYILAANETFLIVTGISCFAHGATMLFMALFSLLYETGFQTVLYQPRAPAREGQVVQVQEV